MNPYPSTIKLRLIHNSTYNKKSGCLEWNLSKDVDGYGQIKIGYKSFRVHRVMLELKLHRKLRPDEFGLHKCNNPACISQARNHVFPGTHHDNMEQAKKDKVMRGYIHSQDRRAWGTGRRREQIGEPRRISFPKIPKIPGLE